MPPPEGRDKNEVSFGYEVKFTPYAPAYFIREAYFIGVSLFHLPQANFIEKSRCNASALFW